MKIAVIPARGGSKRILRKNIKEFCGQPMIVYAINVARETGLFAKIIVSTDDEEIAQISREYGAETPFKRPQDLADDHTPTVPVIAKTIKDCEEIGWQVNYACCIYPCAAFVKSEDINNAFKLLNSSEIPYSFPVTEYPSAIQRSLRRLPNGQMRPFNPNHELTRTQDLENAYYDAGQFYWGSRNAWINESKIHSNGLGLIIPNWRVVDIDVLDDWIRAEIIFTALKKLEGKNEFIQN